jgi:ribosomal-protein-alanine N-acetyltransferase
MAVTLDVVVEPMTLDDIPAVHAIERLSFSTPWPSEAFEEELNRNRLAHYLVARRNGEVLGFGGVWMMVDEAHVTTFSVHPDVRRHGVGTRLLLGLLERARQLGAARMTLEVRVSNAAAQALYAKLGFAEAGIRRGYYTDDGEDALIMTTPALIDPAYVARLDALRLDLEGRA